MGHGPIKLALHALYARCPGRPPGYSQEITPPGRGLPAAGSGGLHRDQKLEKGPVANFEEFDRYSSFDQDYAIMGSGEASGVLGSFFDLSRPR